MITQHQCLNPYFNGTCSKSPINMDERPHRGLNPYFNGTCSKRQFMTPAPQQQPAVLILILMEHAQRAQSTWMSVLTVVLILILMEHAQRDNS